MIEKQAFQDCYNLKTVYIPKGTPETAASLKYFPRHLISYIPKEVEKPVDPAPKFDPKAFPILTIESVDFADNGNNVIEAGEECTIKVVVSNSGKGPASNCTLKVSVNSAPGITVSDVKLPLIQAGKSITQSVVVKSNLSTADGTANFSVAVDEPNGLGTDATLLSVSTKAFEAPKVLVADYSVTGTNGAQLSKKVPFDLQVLVQNLSHGDAENVTVGISLPQNVFLIDGDERASLGALAGGQTREMNYSLLVNNNYTATTIPVIITLKEKHGKYAESKTIDLQLNQPLAAQKIEIKGSDLSKPNDALVAAQIAGKVQQAEVDINIPNSGRNCSETFAVLIGNENYVNEIAVPFAVNDANIMAQYLVSTIGIPENSIRVVNNATKNGMIAQMDWLRSVAKAYPGCNIIVYYSGHGMPDEKTSEPMLIPVDGYSSNINTCYSLATLYGELAELNAGNVTVILDACFSGAERGDNMLVAAKGVRIKPKDSPLSKGSMIVLSASQGDETAYPYREKSHGLFTYFLLKKLQDTKGNVTIGELSDYVTTQVEKISILENNKSQTPSTTVSPSLQNTWRSIRW